MERTHEKYDLLIARAKALAPKDTSATFYSAPILIRVIPPPPATQPAAK